MSKKTQVEAPSQENIRQEYWEKVVEPFSGHKYFEDIAILSNAPHRHYIRSKKELAKGYGTENLEPMAKEYGNLMTAGKRMMRCFNKYHELHQSAFLRPSKDASLPATVTKEDKKLSDVLASIKSNADANKTNTPEDLEQSFDERFPKGKSKTDKDILHLVVTALVEKDAAGLKNTFSLWEYQFNGAIQHALAMHREFLQKIEEQQTTEESVNDAEQQTLEMRGKYEAQVNFRKQLLAKLDYFDSLNEEEFEDDQTMQSHLKTVKDAYSEIKKNEDAKFNDEQMGIIVDAIAEVRNGLLRNDAKRRSSTFTEIKGNVDDFVYSLKEIRDAAMETRNIAFKEGVKFREALQAKIINDENYEPKDAERKNKLFRDLVEITEKQAETVQEMDTLVKDATRDILNVDDPKTDDEVKAIREIKEKYRIKSEELATKLKELNKDLDGCTQSLREELK